MAQNTILNLTVSIDLATETAKLSDLITFLTTSGIAFSTCSGDSAPAPASVAAPAPSEPKTRTSKTSSSGKGKKAKDPFDDKLTLVAEDNHVKVTITALSGDQKGKSHFSTTTWAWIKHQAQLMDANAAYDTHTKMWVFRNKTTAAKFAKAWNGHVVTVDEQVAALAAK